MKNFLLDTSGKTKLAWLLLGVAVLTFVVSSQLIFASEQVDVDAVDVSSATDVGLDTTKGVTLDWIDSESSLTRRCLLIDITADIAAQDVSVYTAEADFSLSQVSSSSLEKKSSESYDVPRYEEQCSTQTINEGNASDGDVEVCEWVNIGTESRTRDVWQDVSVKSGDGDSNAKLDVFSLSSSGEYRYCFDVPIVERADGSFGNYGTVYAQINGGWLVDKQHSSWWNASYSYRKALYANKSSGSGSNQFITANNSEGVFSKTGYLNTSVSTTDAIVAYMYYNSASDYTFANANGDSSIPFYVEESGLNSSVSTLMSKHDAFYTMEMTGGSTYKDVAGSWAGSKNGNADQNSSQTLFNTYLSTNANGDYVSLGDVGDFADGADWSISFWFRYYGESGGSISNTILGRAPNSGGNGMSLFEVASNGDIKIRVRDDPAARDFEKTNTTVDVNDGEWHQSVLTFDGSSDDIYWYLDGGLSHSDTSQTWGSFVSALDYCIGVRCNNGGVTSGSAGYWQFKGDVDSLMFLDEYLSADEVKRSFEYGKSRFGSLESQSGDEDTYYTAMHQGITAALSSATIYTDQQVYVRYLNGTQMLATFDKVAAYGNQRWAFNYVDTGESYTNMYDVSPSFYVWENSSLSDAEIQAQVTAYIQSTKV